MKLRKLFAALTAVCTLSAFAVTASAEGPGIEIRMGESFTGAKINVAEANLQEGHTYLMTIVASAGAAGNGFRVRWATEGENEYNDAGTEPAAHSSETATVKAGENKVYQIPAYFQDVFDIETRNTEKTFYIEFTVGEAIPGLDPLYMDYIVIQGQQGNTAYTIHDLTIEEIGGAAEEAAPAVEEEAATTAATAAAGDTEAAATSTKASADTGIEGIAVILGLALTAAGAVVISRKRK